MKRFIDYFRSNKSASTASVAKERLQIIIAHERGSNSDPDYLPKLQQEIVDVIAKYVHINKDHVKVALDREGDSAVLELNVTLPEDILEEA